MKGLIRVRVQCTYNQEYEIFLKAVVDYVIECWGDELDLSGVETIELVDISEFNYETDGKVYNEGKNILVTSRLYDELDVLDINKCKNSNTFKLIVGTLCHEMGHVSDWKKMPNLYRIVEENSTSAEGVASLFWLEYIVEKRNAEKNIVDHDSFCKDVAKSEWRAYKTDLERAGSDNFTYLCKVLPYFMGRTIDPQKRKKYMGIMRNRLVKEFVIELDREIKKLEKECPFDEPEKLRGLYNIINIFFNKFREAYEPY